MEVLCGNVQGVEVLVVLRLGGLGTERLLEQRQIFSDDPFYDRPLAVRVLVHQTITEPNDLWPLEVGVSGTKLAGQMISGLADNAQFSHHCCSPKVDRIPPRLGRPALDPFDGAQYVSRT
jgi:hypothetical protein